MAHSTDGEVKKVSSKRKNGVIYGLKNTSFGESRYYLFEYGLLLLLTAGLIGILVDMIQAFFNQVSISSFLFFDVADPYVLLLSALTILLPLVIILIQRTAESEHHNPEIKNLAWRKGFLGIFLTVVSIGAVVSSILFINSILTFLSLDVLTKAEFDWETTVKYLASTILLLLTAWTFGNDYRHLGKDHFTGLRHRYRYGLVITSIIVGFLFLVFPFRENRLVLIDRMIVNDLSDIHTLVVTYNAKNNRLPNSISELGITAEQTQRASAYVYTIEKKSGSNFEICANFNLAAPQTDSNNATTLSYPAMETDFFTKLNNHAAGRGCFESSNEASATSSSSNIQQDDDGSYVETYETAPAEPAPITDSVESTTAQ